MKMTLRYAHLPPKHLTSAGRVLDFHSDKSLGSHLTIRPNQTPEGCWSVFKMMARKRRNVLIGAEKVSWCRRRDCIRGVAQVLDDLGNPSSLNSFQALRRSMGLFLFIAFYRILSLLLTPI